MLWESMKGKEGRGLVERTKETGKAWGPEIDMKHEKSILQVNWLFYAFKTTFQSCVVLHMPWGFSLKSPWECLKQVPGPLEVLIQ